MDYKEMGEPDYDKNVREKNNNKPGAAGKWSPFNFEHRWKAWGKALRGHRIEKWRKDRRQAPRINGSKEMK